MFQALNSYLHPYPSHSPHFSHLFLPQNRFLVDANTKDALEKQEEKEAKRKLQRSGKSVKKAVEKKGVSAKAAPEKAAAPAAASKAAAPPAGKK